MEDLLITADKKEGRGKREIQLTKHLVTQGKLGRGATDIVVTTWRMNAVTIPIQNSSSCIDIQTMQLL